MTQEEIIDDNNSVYEILYDNEVETNKLPRYTKWEIENRLYTLIDNETIFPLNEDRCEQGHRVYDHACGVTPKMGVKKKWIVDIDELTKEQVDIICEKICKCRSAFKVTDMRYLKTLSEDLYDNIIAEIPTAHGVHIITHGFDVGRFREILEQTTSITLTKEQIKEIVTVKKDNPTLLYF